MLSTFLKIFWALFCPSCNQYLEFPNNSFWSILCTYPEVCSICVPQDCLCGTSVLVKMVYITWFSYIKTTTQYYGAIFFGPWFMHIRLVHTSRTNISICWNLSYSWIKFYQYHLVQIWLWQVTQAEFCDSDLKSWLPSRFESRRYIDWHI